MAADESRKVAGKQSSGHPTSQSAHKREHKELPTREQFPVCLTATETVIRRCVPLSEHHYRCSRLAFVL